MVANKILLAGEVDFIIQGCAHPQVLELLEAVKSLVSINVIDNGYIRIVSWLDSQPMDPGSRNHKANIFSLKLVSFLHLQQKIAYPKLLENML